MPLTSFCFVFSVQVGAVVVAAVYFTIACVISAANIFGYHQQGKDLPLDLILVILFIIDLIVIGVVIFISVKNENMSIAWAGLILIGITGLFWLLLCFLSFFGNRSQVESVCIENRCPESFWIASLTWRHFHIEENSASLTNVGAAYNPKRYSHYHRNKNKFVGGDEEDEYRLKRDNSKGPDSTDDVTLKSRTIFIDMDLSTYSPRNSTKKKANSEPRANRSNLAVSEKIKEVEVILKRTENGTNNLIHESKNRLSFLQKETNSMACSGADSCDHKDDVELHIGLPFIGAIVLFFVNLIYMMSSAVVVWSWASELRDYEEEEEEYGGNI